MNKKKIATLIGLSSAVGVSVFLTACNNTPKQQVQVAKSQYLSSNYRASFYTTYNAAQLGNRDAEYALGYFYYYGIGVPRDVVKGRIWIGKAANHGLPAAIEAMQLMNQAAPTPFTQNNSRAGSRPMPNAPGQQPMVPSQRGGAAMPPPSIPSGQQSAPSAQRAAPPPPPNIKIARPSLRMDTSALDYYTPPTSNTGSTNTNSSGNSMNAPAAGANPPAAGNNNAPVATSNNSASATSSPQPVELGAPPAAPSQPPAQPQPGSTPPSSAIPNEEPAAATTVQ